MSNFALFYDSETQSLPLWNEPSEHPAQPHVVQLAACLVDLDSRKTISSLDLIIKPDGWTIPADVVAIHGITTEHAKAVGVPESLAVGFFLEMWKNSIFRCAHNESFDARIIRIACMRFFPHMADTWKCSRAECTQLLATPILKLPPTERMLAAGRTHFKSANLSEAYKHFTGRELENAHSAMADVQACIQVYFKIKEKLK